MDEQWQRRIDRHLEASEDHMRRGNEIMARNERAFLDLQSYLREATAMLAMMAAGIHEQTLAFVASQRELRKEIREHREETREELRAQRAALFAMLDRFNDGPPPSGA